LRQNNKIVKKKSLFFKFIIIIFAVILTFVIAILLWQRENIKAVIDSTKYSKDEIASKIDDSKKDVSNTLSEYNISVRDFTLEEEELLLKGELSVEEAVSKILGNESSDNNDKENVSENQTLANNVSNESQNTADNTSNKKQNSDDNASNKKQNSDDNASNKKQSSADNTSNENQNLANDSTKNSNYNENQNNSNSESSNELEKKINEKVAKIYGIKAYYLGKLGALESEVKAQYNALPEGSKNSAAIKNIISSNIGTAVNLESSCDNEIETVLSELEAILKDSKQDTAIVDKIRDAYIDEKALKKSYYLSLYK